MHHNYYTGYPPRSFHPYIYRPPFTKRVRPNIGGFPPGVSFGPGVYPTGSASPVGMLKHMQQYKEQQQQVDQKKQQMEQQAQKEEKKQQEQKNKQEKEQKEQGEQKQKKQGQKKKKSGALMSFDKLQVGTVSSSSGIFNGNNIQFGWSSHSKKNTGFGTVGGHHNTVDKNTNVVFDNDQLDTPIDDRDTMWSPVPNINNA